MLVMNNMRRSWMQIAAAAAAAGLVAFGAVFLIARRRRPRTVGARLHEAKSSIGDRLERPVSTIKTAAGRLAR